jgi:hypothetical protein
MGAPMGTALFLCLFLPSAASLSLFMRTTWLAEVPEATWRSWFELVKRGRADGPSSPFYVEELGLQNTACCESHARPGYKALGCLGPKCSELGLAPYSLLTKELDLMSEYFHLFKTVYIGTTVQDGFSVRNLSSISSYAALQASIGRQFLARYGDLKGVNYAWYHTEEGSLCVPLLSVVGPAHASACAAASLCCSDTGAAGSPARRTYIASDPQLVSGWKALLPASMNALYAVKPMPFLWSPSNGQHTPNATERATEEAALEDILCSLPHPLALHFQDWLGQSVTFEFPFHYNYTNAFTCEKDTVPTFAMFTRIQQACPQQLREVKVNAELFAERLSPDGKRGEDNGANIINADPHEVYDRLQCYQRHSLPVGCSWAMPHWFSLMTYANATVYHPY